MGKANETVKAERKRIVDEALELMQGGRLDWANELCGTVAPCNYVTGRRYNGGNVLHLGCARRRNGWSDPRFLTFAQAKANGLKVRKGERGSIVEHWKLVRFGGGDEADETAEGIDSGRIRPVLVGYWRVFNVEQCDGEVKPIPEIVHSDDDLIELSERIEAASPCPVNVCMTDVACYKPMRDRIEIYPREAARSVNGWTRVLLHEMTHATGHSSRLDRDIVNRFGSPDYAREELVAELGAAFLSAEVGLPAQSATEFGESEHARQHAAYLQSWIAALEDDPDELFRAASKASAAADYLGSLIDPGSAQDAA